MNQANEGRMAGGKILALGIVLAVFWAAMMLVAEPANASTFSVNSTGDTGDSTPDGTCDNCTLRHAIQEANASPGADNIKFNIPGIGTHTISPASPLPNITDTVTIDGYTQPGTRENTLARGTNAQLLVELNGENAGPATGLQIFPPSGKSATGSVLRGLAINRFTNGISIVNARGVRVEGNFLGTDPSGTLDRGNGNSGVFYNNAVDSTIGGTVPAARNLISGNGVGISLGVFAFTARIEGNLIGTGKDGISPLGNDANGVNISAGRTNPDPNNIVGGDTAAAANTIAFNGGDGVEMDACAFAPQSGEFFCGIGNSVSRNSIFSNGGLGINLNSVRSEGANGVTANDPGDVDDENDGPNNLQNFPVLVSAKTGGETTIKGRLNSAPNTTFALQFFSNPPGGNEGKKFIGQKRVTTGADGNVSFTKEINPAVAAGRTITATATDSGGNTSEFSAPREVVTL
jgi:CSLREA domain-containing protein